MKLIVENLEYNIKNFNHSIYFQNADGRGYDSATAIFDGDYSITEVAEAIKKVFNGNFTINTGTRNVSFSEYELGSIDYHIDSDREDINIRFEKN